MNSWDDLMRLTGEMGELGRRTIQRRIKLNIEHQLAVQQLLRFGVCPCILQGRYSTCCATKLGDLK